MDHIVQMTLRERRRIETTRMIQAAALDLAADRGIGVVTVEAICERAGISQRTFFNYFPFKDAVFVIPGPPLPPQAVKAFLASTADILTDLVDLFVAQAEEMQNSGWDDRILFEFAKANPRLLTLQMAAFANFERQLRDILAARLKLQAVDLRCQMLVSAMVGANRPVMDAWRENPALGLPSLVRKSLLDLVRYMRATGGQDTPDDNRLTHSTT